MPAADQQSFKTALAEAFGHRSYVLLVLGFFTCGFQLAFITVHLPAYLVDRGISAQTGGWVIAAIGLFNIIGSLGVGWLQNRFPKRYILSAIYFAACAVDRRLHLVPDHHLLRDRVRRRHRPDLALDGAADLGAGGADVRHPLVCDAVSALPSSAIRSAASSASCSAASCSRQFGSYTPIWWLSVLFGVLSALINLPIVEAPVARPVAQPA